MSIVIPNIANQGGSIHLQYAPADPHGISNKVTISLTLDIQPASDVPKVILELELPEGHFRFNNNAKIITKDLGKMNNGDAINYEFVILCDILNPSDVLAMIVSTRDKAAPINDLRSKILTYTVKISVSTPENLKIAFLSN
jgi:hypothetical protein